MASRRVAIHGTGRMAEAIHAAVSDHPEVRITALAGPQRPGWKTSVDWYQRLEDLDGQDGALPELLIDFTLPDGTRSAAAWCRSRGVALLSGVTGLPEDALDVLRLAGENVPVLWSPNLSLGVNLMADLAARAAAVVDREVPVLIEDIHHQWKKDAPSGTALMLGSVIAGQRGGEPAAIEYRSVREGEIVGEHTVSFDLGGEEFALVHRARDRSIYAHGALRAGLWLLDQQPGFYSARDWLAAC